MTIQQKIIFLKAKKGITTDELSKLSGVPKGTINKILNGETSTPKSNTLTALCNALECSADYLLDNSIDINDVWADGRMSTSSDLDAAILGIVHTLTDENKQKILELAKLYAGSQ